MINISQRKAAEAQVEEERFLLRQLIDHVPLKIYFKDLDPDSSWPTKAPPSRWVATTRPNLSKTRPRLFPIRTLETRGRR